MSSRNVIMPRLVEDIKSMKYSDLQKLAKEIGIRANQKSERLRKELQQYYKANQDGKSSEGHQNDSRDSNSNSKSPAVVQSVDAKLDVPKVENKSGSGQVKRKRKRTFELDEASLGPSSTPTSVCSLKTTTNSDAAVKSPARKQIRRGTFEKDGSSVTKEERGESKVKGRRRTFELEEPTLNKDCTPTSDTNGKGKRPSRSKSGSAKSGKNMAATVVLRKRSSGSKSSPSTRAMIQSMDATTSDADMKASLLSALDKKVQEKVADTEDENGQQASRIPRFMTVLAKIKEKQAQQKPASPGSKNWTKIHNKAFSKFDSIDVYLEKKRQRMDVLNSSGKKVATNSPRIRQVTNPAKSDARAKTTAQQKAFVPTVISTKNMSLNFGNKTPSSTIGRTKTKTPPSRTARSGNSTNSQRRSGPKIAKPVIKAKRTTQQKGFVPSVVSTKNMSFNFSGKTPSTTPAHNKAKTPGRTAKEAPKPTTATKTPRQTDIFSPKKTITSVKGDSVFRFTGNKNLNNTVASAQKPTFDLKASLSKPLPYKPHTGRLQPLDTNRQESSLPIRKPSAAKAAAGPRPSRQALASKTRHATVKNVQRNQQLDRRNNVKYIEMMKKRGLM